MGEVVLLPVHDSAEAEGLAVCVQACEDATENSAERVGISGWVLDKPHGHACDSRTSECS